MKDPLPYITVSFEPGFPFRRLLRLAGLRWRYSNPPPNGTICCTVGRVLRSLLSNSCTSQYACTFTWYSRGFAKMSFAVQGLRQCALCKLGLVAATDAHRVASNAMCADGATAEG
jgi:hypothetical protein